MRDQCCSCMAIRRGAFLPRLRRAADKRGLPRDRSRLDWLWLLGSSAHQCGLTFAHHIADLVSLMNQLRIRGFVIVGQDWGGPQGIGAALQRVERLDALVLMNTWLFTDYIGKFRQFSAALDHLARSADRAAIDEALQGSFAWRSFGNHAARHHRKQKTHLPITCSTNLTPITWC